MATRPLFERFRDTQRVRCEACFDSGLVLFAGRTIIGVADLLDNSAPCTCPLGDLIRPEFEAKETPRKTCKNTPPASGSENSLTDEERAWVDEMNAKLGIGVKPVAATVKQNLTVPAGLRGTPLTREEREQQNRKLLEMERTNAASR